MTILEQIAEKMGWKTSEDIKTNSEDAFKLAEVKLLQARMVEDGWGIIIQQFGKSFWVEATKPGQEGEDAGGDSEPAAIVELFKKVYGIKDGA